MPTQSRSALERQPRDEYVYRVNALIGEGQDELAMELVTEARQGLANIPAAHVRDNVANRDPRVTRPGIRHPARTLVCSGVTLVRSSDLAIGYAVAVVVIAVVLSLLSKQTHDRVVLDCSTNLVNLRAHPLWVLFASAFVVSSLIGLWQIPLLLLLYAAAQRWVGRAATIVVALIGHVGATLFVATLLTTGIFHGWLARSIARTSDVGISYGLACLTGFLLLQVPRRWRIGYLIMTLGYFVSPLLYDPNPTSVGHTTALTLGLGVALVADRAATARVEGLDGVAHRVEGRCQVPKTLESTGEGVVSLSQSGRRGRVLAAGGARSQRSKGPAYGRGP
jgi:hypothetical protein